VLNSHFELNRLLSHAFNQAYTQATDTNQKGIWQVTPTKHDWDHVDFVGQDYPLLVYTLD
jgi:triacylglycerol esterase/lipase EstA (alpha/beta hydrolase family)